MSDKFAKHISLFLFTLIADNDFENLDTIIQTFKEQIDINIIYDGLTPLYKAVKLNHIECVKVLIKAVANNVDYQKWNGYTALIKASENGNLECINLLIDARANLDAQTNNGYTALMIAVSKNKLDCVKALIKAGAPLDIQSKESGDTALILAAYFNYPELVQLLIDSGANPYITNKHGKTALSYASHNSYGKCGIECSLMLQKAIENPKPLDETCDLNAGETPVKQNDNNQEIINLINNLERKIDDLNIKIESLETVIIELYK